MPRVIADDAENGDDHAGSTDPEGEYPLTIASEHTILSRTPDSSA